MSSIYPIELLIDSESSIGEVCDLYDAQVIWALGESPGSTDDNPIWHHVCTIGWKEDPDAGIRGGPLLPNYFDSLQELEDYCQEFLPQLRTEAAGDIWG